MTRLTPEERATRDAQREEERKAANRKWWADAVSKTRPLVADAGAQLVAAFDKKELKIREVWLILGLFETYEKIHLEGKSESIKTKWFDGIAPDAKGKISFRGMSGFTARTALKASAFIKGSGNGYVYLTDLGMAAAQWLRQNFPSLVMEYTTSNMYQTVPMGELGEMPPPRWRLWKDWDSK